METTHHPSWAGHLAYVIFTCLLFFSTTATSQTTPPVITCPANLTIECTASTLPPNTGTATATTTDNCSTPAVTFGDVTVAGGCPQELTITRTWLATDGCGNTSTCDQTIFVDDSTPPVITCPANLTIECTASTLPADTGTATATDNCSTPAVTFSDVTVAGGCPQEITITRTWLASDGCGNTSTCDQTIFVDDTTPPVITCPANLTIECTASTLPANTGVASATDNCSIPLVTFNDVTAAGVCIQELTITRTWSATDGCGNTSTCDQTIFVDDSTPPVITCPTNVTIECTASTRPLNTGFATATDNCSIPTVAFSDVTVAGGCPQERTITRTWLASDGCGNTSTCDQTIFVDDSTPPVITCPADVTIDCTDSTLPADTGIATATDNCSIPIVTFSEVTIAGSCPDAYIITRTFTATDACLNSSTCTQTVTVQDTTAPVITCPADLLLECTDTLTTDLATATDNCSDTILLDYTDILCNNPVMGFTGPYAFSNWTTFIPPQGGSVTPMGDNEVMLTSPNSTSNCAGAATMFSIVIPLSGQLVFDWNYTTVDVDGPAFDPFGYRLNGIFFQLTNNSGPDTQNGTVSIAVVAGNTFAFEQRSTDCILGAGATTVVEFFACVQQAEAEICSQLVIRTHTATDECGNSASCVQTLFIEDSTSPDIICPPDTIISLAESTDPASTGTATATDNCSMTALVTFSDLILPTCDSFFLIQRTWTATDGCSNSSTCLQEIEVTVPITGDVLACFDQLNISIDNDCGTVILSGMILTGEEAGNNSLTVIIKDLNGNIVPNATFTFEHVGQTFTVMVLNECTGQSCWGYVTVEDKLGPLIDCTCPVSEGSTCTISCLQIADFLNGDIPAELQPTVIDNCGGATIEIVNIELSFETCSGGFIRVTWLATDAFGNTSTCEQVFDIEPLTLETLTFPADFVGECNGSSDPSITGWPQVDGKDLTNIPSHCNIIATYTDLVLPLCGGGTKIIRTWTVFDWCVPEVREFVQSIILMDRTGPVLTCSEDLTVGTSVWYCSADVIIPKPVAVDACSDITAFQLFYELGVVIPIGNIFRVNDLLVGTHTFRWIVTDECGNESTCSFDITVIDNVPPVVACKQHLIVGLTSDRPNGITLVSAEVFDDGSFDNCSPVSFRARRMDSCIDFNWTTGGACVDDIPGGIPAFDAADAGTVPGICVPFSCCDIGAGPIMIELEVTDAASNVNYCMVEVEVQDKLVPDLICPPTISVSCEFDFEPIQGVFLDLNNDGSLDEDPLSAIFGNIFDALRHDESERSPIIINDPNGNGPQPFNWGIDGWATDNCEVNLQVTVSVFEDCSGAGLPGDPPPGAIKLITRRFIANDGSGGLSGSCLQRIWVIDYEPFFITDTTCTNQNPLDGVIWPCDVELSFCPDELNGTGEPLIFEDHCSIIGVSFEDTRFDFADGSCYKVLREWSIIDWCQFDGNTGFGIWSYVQVIKVLDASGPLFLDCPQGLVEFCLGDPGITLPANNQTILGENNPDASSCSVHVALSHRIRELCSESVIYDVKLYPFNGDEYIQIKPTTVLPLDANHEGVLSFNTQESTMQSISEDGLPYNDPLCNDSHRLVWTVQDGCGNQSSCDYVFRLEDCKDPTPVCLNGLSSAIMSDEGEVTIWASDFDASSFDDCTPSGELLFSFSGTTYQPSFTYTCENVPVIGDSIDVEIWVADEGSDQNCNGVVEWNERNKDFCVTFITIDDPAGICIGQGALLEGEIMTEHTAAVSKVAVHVAGPQGSLPVIVTSTNGKFSFADVPQGEDYVITAERNDDHRNGVSTLDLVAIQKHLLGKASFTSPYQYIASDANNSGSVSAIDLIEIRKLILGLYQTYPSNKSWRFVKEDSEMAAGNPWPFDELIEIDNLNIQQANNLDFIGVKIGDVNNTVIANAFQIQPRDSRRLMKVNAVMKSEMKINDIIEIRFVLPEITSGFQWTLETKGLEFITVKSKDIPIDDANAGVRANGIVTMSWNGEPFDDDYSKQDLSFVIQFRVLEPGRLHEMISISDLVTEAEAYTLSGEIMDVALEFDDSKFFTDFALYQNQPNPWNEQTLIGFDLPEDAFATLTVYDVAGKVIKTIEGPYMEGYNAILLTESELPGSGILYYRLESGEYSATKKMMIIP